MKKILALMMAVVILFGQIMTGYAQIGDIITYTKYTDIYAYINNYIIPSYNIEGYTGIVAEDLRYYGFDVVWNETERTLSISRNSLITQITEYLQPAQISTAKLGKDAFSVLETDIKTFVNGNEVKSYNIGGKTVVVFDSLSVFGGIEWNEYSRKIKLWINDGLNNAGFETEPIYPEKVTLYSADGRTVDVCEDEVGEYLSVGWYKTYNEAQSENEYLIDSVYRTPTGKRYHYDPDCGGKNSYEITMQQATRAGLTPCKKCAY